MKNCFWLQRHIVPRVVGLEVWGSEGETTAEEVVTCHHHQFCVNFRRSPGGICWVTIRTASSNFVHFAKHGADDSLEDPMMWVQMTWGLLMMQFSLDQGSETALEYKYIQIPFCQSCGRILNQTIYYSNVNLISFGFLRYWSHYIPHLQQVHLCFFSPNYSFQTMLSKQSTVTVWIWFPSGF